MNKKRLNKKKVLLVFIPLIIAGTIIYWFLPSNSTKTEEKQPKKTVNNDPQYYQTSLKERYENYQKTNPDLSTEEIITRVNMNLDYPFYEVIIPQNKPLELNTIVNKYYKFLFTSMILMPIQAILPINIENIRCEKLFMMILLH